jgi:YVTN family beta-propeller protein
VGTARAIVVCVIAIASLAGVSIAAGARPRLPIVSGPSIADGPLVRYRFASSEAGVPAARLRFLCAVDAQALHRCPAVFAVRLSAGVHRLRVQAVDPQGRRSATKTVRVEIVGPPAPSVRVGSQPLDVIVADGRLWTENYGDGTVSVIDPATRKVTSIQVGGQPGGIAAGAGSIWVTDLGDGTLTRLSEAGKVQARIPLGGQSAGVAVGNGVVYVADYTGGLGRVDAATNKVIGRTKMAGRPEAVAVGFGRVWVTNSDGTIAAVDPDTGALDGAPITVGDDADGVSIGQDAVWAVALYGQALVRIDPSSRQVTLRMKTPGQASGVLATGDAVWVSLYDRSAVVRIDPTRKAVVRTYHVGPQPRSIASAAGSIWVANQRGDSLSRIAP